MRALASLALSLSNVCLPRSPLLPLKRPSALWFHSLFPYLLFCFYVSLTQARSIWEGIKKKKKKTTLIEKMPQPDWLMGKQVWYFLDDLCGYERPGHVGYATPGLVVLCAMSRPSSHGEQASKQHTSVISVSSTFLPGAPAPTSLR